MNKTVIVSFLVLLTVSELCAQDKCYPLFPTEEEKAIISKELIRQQDSLEAAFWEAKDAGKRSEREAADYSFGAIPLQEGVSPSGARTYNILIPTASGFSPAPSVSLSYNSQAGEGLAGWGWDIQGLSCIRLINKNDYYHGEISAASSEAAGQVFALDGVPLVQNDDSATAGAYPLRTAKGHILASPEENAYGYIARFYVLYPDGTRATYGRGATYNYLTVFYHIVEMTDREGHRISFHYTTDNLSGNDRISSIRYGYDAAGDYHAELSFSYTSRPHILASYFAGRQIQDGYVLSSVDSRCEGELLARYSLTYEQTDNTCLLSRFDCTNAEGGMLPPLEFTHSSGTSSPGLTKDLLSITLPVSYFDPDHDNVYKRGKFIGGEFRDGVLIHPGYPTYQLVPNGTGFNFHYSSGFDPNQAVLFIPRLKNSTSYDAVSVKAGYGFQTIDAVDVDGDGTDEIVRVNLSTAAAMADSRISISVFKCNAQGQASLQYTQDVDLPNSTFGSLTPAPYQRAFFWGDFLGSGMAQLLAIAYKHPLGLSIVTQECYVSLIEIREDDDSLPSALLCNDPELFDLEIEETGSVIACDIDGDGKAELCHATADGFDIYRFHVSGTSGNRGQFALESHLASPTSAVLADTTRRYHLTDINGDGLLDIVRPPVKGSSSNTWTSYRYTGTEFMTQGLSITTRAQGDEFMFMDVNMDGLADLVKVNGTTLSSYINYGTTAFGSAQVSSSSIIGAKGIVPANPVAWKASSAFIKFDSLTVSNWTYSHIAPAVRQIYSVRDSYGKVFHNSYAYLPSYASAWADSGYAPSSAQGYTLSTLPIYVLTQEYDYGSDSQSSLYKSIVYEYSNCVVHNRGLGFCGFSKIKATERISVAAGIRQIVTSWSDPEKMGVLTRMEKSLGDGTPFYTQVNTWDNHSTTYGKLSPRLSTTTETDALSGVQTTTDYYYDSFDFPTETVTLRTRSGQTQQREQHKWTYSHSNSPSLYVLGTVSQEAVRRDLDGSYTRTWKTKSIYTLDNLKRPTSRADYRGVSKGPASSFRYESTDSTLLVSTTRWTYDAFGNVASQKSAPYSATEFLGTTYVYDSLGRFIVSATDALGHTTTYSGYNIFGKPACKTDYAGRSVSYAYDSWGNLTQTTFADGSTQAVTTAWGGDGLYTVTTTATGRPTSIVHYDALGRELRSGSQRFDSQWQWTARQYDSRGRLGKVSLPYRTATADGTGTPLHWNTYSYDSYDRPTVILEASGRQTSWAYSGAMTTTVREGIASTKTVDTFGNLVSVVDPGGTVTYTLRDDAQPSMITAPGSVQTTFTYDAYGRRTSIVDPSAGTHSDSYVFNADGSSVTTHSGPNGTVVTSVDKYGRTTSVVRTGEFSTTYSYDTYGKLTGETSTNGTATSYVYDSLDRVVSLREDAPDGKWLQKTIGYGPGSVVDSVRYVSQAGYITTELYSYAGGHNTAILLPDGTVVFSLVSENALGQPTQITTGTVTREYGFSAYGLPTSRTMTASASAGGGTLQSVTYSFAPATGNLVGWSDNLNATHGSYSYDALGRLTGALNQGDGGTDSKSFSYDGTVGTVSAPGSTKGNVTAMSGIGTMSYTDSSDPYKLTTYTPASGSPFPARNYSLVSNAEGRPSVLTENSRKAYFTYDAEGDRVKMRLTNPTGTGTVLSRYYVGGRYEFDQKTGSNTEERFYLGGDAYSAPMVLKRSNGGSWTLYNIGRDYLGSITHIATADGTLVAEYSYDPWGRLRNPATLALYTSATAPALFLARGYTGHEHLPEFGLINMNARLYNPAVGRFLSPDPYIQAPDLTQNYNRYAYCLNNPLKYSDESGESILLAMGIGAALFGFGNLAAHAIRRDDLGHGNWAKYFFSGALAGAIVGAAAFGVWSLSTAMLQTSPSWFWSMTKFNSVWGYPALTGVNFVSSAINGIANKNNQWFNNFAKTVIGNFYLDENKSFFGQVYEGISRHTLESAQQFIGYAYSCISNGWSDRVDLWGGATFVTNFVDFTDGITIGSMININAENDIINTYSSFNDYMLSNEDIAQDYYVHEYGHTIQSKIWGPAYLFGPGLWSGISAIVNTSSVHDIQWSETWANSYSKVYFAKHFPGYTFPASLITK